MMAVTGQREGCGSQAAAQVMMKPVSHRDMVQSALLHSAWVMSLGSAFLGSYADVTRDHVEAQSMQPLRAVIGSVFLIQPRALSMSAAMLPLKPVQMPMVGTAT